jgi:histidyl-tRNA synthetase
MSLGAREGSVGLLAYVATAGTNMTGMALGVQRRVRDAGIACEAALVQRPLAKQMEEARRMGASWVLVVGEKEAKAGGATLRDMETGKEELLKLEEAIRRMKGAGGTAS